MQKAVRTFQESLMCPLKAVNKDPVFSILRIKVELNSYQTDKKSTDLFMQFKTRENSAINM